MAAATIRTSGFDELIRACRKLGATELRRMVQRELQDAAKPVADAAKERLGRYRGASVSTIRPRVRGSSAFVQQSKGKVTGRRGDFGSLIMQKALIPALDERQDEVIRSLENAIERLAGDEGF